jgi:tRNA pseudouridine32 synthase/23S rRNA pseudouridine746 synthase
MHQIRVHLAAIERPILGDVRYGGALTAAGEAVPRLMLHASVLEFPHPAGGVRVVTADPPQDFRTVLERAGLDLRHAAATAAIP